MRILFLTEAFPPETKSASTLFFELAESLVKSGHKVTIITRIPRYNVASGIKLKNTPQLEILSGIEVHRFKMVPFARNIPIFRGFEHFLLGFLFFWGGLFFGKFDLILVYSPPLPLGIAGFFLGKIKNCPLVVNIQDLYPQTVIDLGLLKNKMLIKIMQFAETFIYKNADALTVHSEGNKEYVVKRGGRNNATKVIHNWVDTESIKPGDKTNDFSRKFKLDGKFVVSFAGVMGFAQGLEVVLKTAKLLEEYKDIVFILVGDGVKKAGLEKMAQSMDLANIAFIQTQPRDIYPDILHASDICLVTLGKDLATPVIPGKILSIMAAGKPILASIPLNRDAHKIIEKYNCGVAVEAGKPDLLAQAILKLYNDTELCKRMGANGRITAEKEFSRVACVDMYEKLFYSLSESK